MNGFCLLRAGAIAALLAQFTPFAVATTVTGTIELRSTDVSSDLVVAGQAQDYYHHIPPRCSSNPERGCSSTPSPAMQKPPRGWPLH